MQQQLHLWYQVVSADTSTHWLWLPCVGVIGYWQTCSTLTCVAFVYYNQSTVCNAPLWQWHPGSRSTGGQSLTGSHHKSSNGGGLGGALSVGTSAKKNLRVVWRRAKSATLTPERNSWGNSISLCGALHFFSLSCVLTKETTLQHKAIVFTVLD